jgi:hypothetical protein
VVAALANSTNSSSTGKSSSSDNGESRVISLEL